MLRAMLKKLSVSASRMQYF